MERYDVVVVGVGGMGSAAVYHLARRGKRVLGLERFDVPHEQGSSHGLTRIIRLAYYEHPTTCRCCVAPTSCGASSRREAASSSCTSPGSSRAASQIFDGSSRSCAEHGLPHEVLTGAEVTQRFPGYRLPADTGRPSSRTAASSSPSAASSRTSGRARRAAPSACARARARVGGRPRAASGSAPTADASRPSDSFSPRVRGRRTSRGSRPAPSERSARCWPGSSRRDRSSSQPERMPGLQPHRRRATTTTAFPPTASPASSSAGTTTWTRAAIPTTIDREPTLEDEELLRAFAERYFPDGAGPTIALKTCLFEPSPDEHFLIDLHPGVGSRRRRRRLLGPRLQVLLGRRRDPRRPRDRRDDAPRHRAVPPRPLLSDRPMRAGGLEPPRALRPNGT